MHTVVKVTPSGETLAVIGAPGEVRNADSRRHAAFKVVELQWTEGDSPFQKRWRARLAGCGGQQGDAAAIVQIGLLIIADTASISAHNLTL
ncbi:hypothetical protein [Noviherbaspirillum sp.]|uniref:hypothetical protein n=1 Tax=Noviherbaspirillum sp. TaxID=1926288 RepID=UPI002FE04741